MMDKDYYPNSGIPPSHPLEYETISWNEQSFLEPNSSIDQYSHFESALSSMVSSPVASTSGLSNDAFLLRELIGKLGAAAAAGTCYATPLSSPPKLNLPITDQMNIPNLGNSIPLISADPGFAERAAKFSCFGSRSFNGRSSQFGVNNAELRHAPGTQLMGNVKLGRISSIPSLKQDESPVKMKNLSQPQMEFKVYNNGTGSFANSNEESSVSEQIPSGETGSKTSNEMNSRKRKGVTRRKCKDDGSNSAKGVELDEDANAKRSKPNKIVENENCDAKINEEPNGVSKKDANTNPPEAPKDYIHVRARRGQATDSHSLAERVRREKISERMTLLQDLVPGCNKVTGKALMLDEIINYVQSLQRQVEFLSMKLASVNPGHDFKMENLISKDMFQSNTTLPQQIYPLDSSASAFSNHLPQQNIQLHNTNISDGFDVTLPQFPGFSEDDLHSIVQMGFGQNPVNFHVLNHASDMKVER